MKLFKTVNNGTFSSIYLTDEDTVYKHFKNEKNSGQHLAPVEISILRCLEHCSNYVQFDKIIYSGTKISGFTMVKYNEDLHQVIHKNNISTITKKNMMQQILNALLHLHEIDIIHGDVKPSNILVDNENNAVLCDFNSCHFLSPIRQDCNNNSYTYTLWYRPPEVILEKPITKYSDIWSIGVMFVELLTGKLGVMTNFECPIEDNEHNKNFIFQTQFEFFKKENKSHFWKQHKIVEKEEISFLSSFLKLEPTKRSPLSMLLCHPYFENYKKQPTKTPLNTIKSFSLFNVEIKFENIENEMNFLKKELKALNINSLRYKSKKDFYEEIIHYTHYIYVITKNNYDSMISPSVHLLHCLMIALKFLDPYNELIYILQRRLNDTQAWMYTQFSVLFQNTVYYIVHSKIQEPSDTLKELLKTMLYFSFPEDTKSTEDVASMLIDFSENKNQDHIYYINLKNKNDALL